MTVETRSGTGGSWMPRVLGMALAVVVVSSAPAAPVDDITAAAGVRLGSGTHTYDWVGSWLDLPDGMSLGNTHGAVAVDSQGRIYFNTDSAHAVVVVDGDGGYLSSWGKELAGGLHGMAIVQEDDAEYVYLTHTGRHEVVKATLDGRILWRLAYPVESGLYEKPDHYRPTSVAVAPDGDIYIADGYGLSWVHVYDKDRNYIRSIGGPGTEPGKFRTPHGVWIDTRRPDQPVLVVADRENHRLQVFDLDGGHLSVVDGFRRPCMVHQHGSNLVVPDLAGRVTILDANNELVAHLGDNPDPAKRARNDVAVDAWRDGEFLSPHGAAFDARGNLYVLDWNRHGRVSKLGRVSSAR